MKMRPIRKIRKVLEVFLNLSLNLILAILKMRIAALEFFCSLLYHFSAFFCIIDNRGKNERRNSIG